MNRLIIARHGNTFSPGDVVRRIGAGTDTQLVEVGVGQARKLGQYFKGKGWLPDAVFASQLLRTQQTAKYILAELGINKHAIALSRFNEIDYGDDENQPEEAVVARLGNKALQDWDEHGIVPDGWYADPKAIADWWKEFATAAVKQKTSTILVVTSAGIARFALSLCKEKPERTKLPTGSFGVLINENRVWRCQEWATTPP